MNSMMARYGPRAPVDFPDALGHERRVMPESTGGLGVYVHFPYCRSICPYCDFAVEVSREVPHERYARAVLAELDLRAGDFEGLGPVRSVFFGGGTPSLWDPIWVGNVLRGLERRLGASPGIEISLEANPEDRDADRLRALRDAGVNRLSWGVQSFLQPVLRTLGRGHRSDQAALAVELSLQLGFPAVSVDLDLRRCWSGRCGRCGRCRPGRVVGDPPCLGVRPHAG